MTRKRNGLQKIRLAFGRPRTISLFMSKCFLYDNIARIWFVNCSDSAKMAASFISRMDVVAASSGSGRAPPSLYDLSLHVWAEYLNKGKWDKQEILTLPDNVFVDLYFAKAEWIVVEELWDLDIFYRMLKSSSARLKLQITFHLMVNRGVDVSRKISESYRGRCEQLTDSSHACAHTRDGLIDLGLRLGGFLNELGWYSSAEEVLIACRDVCQSAPHTTHYIRITLECCHRLLHAQASYCSFKGASETFALSISLLKENCLESSDVRHGAGRPRSPAVVDSYLMDTWEPWHCEKREYCAVDRHIGIYLQRTDEASLNDLLLRLYREFALLHFQRSDYGRMYKWATRALKLLGPDTPPKITVDVLRICGKACVMMRQFNRAGLIMREVVALARQWFGPCNPHYALTLLDYGFYLLNVDSILYSVTVYEEALGILISLYDGKNIHVAIAHEDLSYALYVHEYSSGRFFKAREHADKAIAIMESMLPTTHLMLATAKRVKALILEEIALDTPPGLEATNLLAESESLHRTALTLSLMAFGEMNVQTAKHYGNLGRLYQSMQKYTDAELMQKRAIDIKEKLLGTDDYEVGLSVGHLASLYSYHMNMFTEAEKLYYRSIEISLKLFGERYSGLEYDYSGLVHVNTELKRPQVAAYYSQQLQRWRSLQEQPSDKQQLLAFGKEVAIPIPQLKDCFFNVGRKEDAGVESDQSSTSDDTTPCVV